MRENLQQVKQPSKRVLAKGWTTLTYCDKILQELDKCDDIKILEEYRIHIANFHDGAGLMGYGAAAEELISNRIRQLTGEER